MGVASDFVLNNVKKHFEEYTNILKDALYQNDELLAKENKEHCFTFPSNFAPKVEEFNKRHRGDACCIHYEFVVNPRTNKTEIFVYCECESEPQLYDRY